MDPTTKILFTAMLSILNIWAPDGVSKEREAEIARLATLFVQTGQEGKIISKEVDPFVLASVSYYESHWTETVLGDCRITKPEKQFCSSFGTMQLSIAAPTWLPRLDPMWKGITIEELKKPVNNVKAGYQELAYFHRACKRTVGHTLSAYRYGRCVKKINFTRCFLAKELAKANGITNWKCGHEGMVPGKLAKEIQKALADMSSGGA